MSSKKASSRLHTVIKAALVGMTLPAIIVYMIVAKPDYRFVNGAAHIIMPVVNAVGDLVTWPLRAGGNIIKRIHSISKLEEENEELRAKLASANALINNYNVAVVENQKLSRELGVARSIGFSPVVADIVLDNSALHHETFIVNRGTNDGIENGMVVVSFDNTLVGIVIDSASHFARVRSLSDSNTNIAVRIAGSEVYGFLHGNGLLNPTIGFLSDYNFQVSPGIRLVTSGIGGVLPNGIYVGKLKNETDVDVISPSTLSRVMVLKFNAPGGKYQ